MPKDETIELLTEIRDLQREHLSLLKAEKMMSAHDQQWSRWMTIGKGLANVLIVVFVIGAFYYFYHTIYGSGLL